MSNWNAELYLRYAGERTQPSIDLVRRVQLNSPARVIDLGCGPGNSTAILRERWPGADILGLDSSAAMIAKVRADFPDGNWEEGDIATWSSAHQFDLVFSNAALQWLPDHATLIPRIFAQVAAGGALAVQIPAHLSSPFHLALLEIADDPEWRNVLAPARGRLEVHDPNHYYDWLCAEASKIDLWVTTYQHVLADADAIGEWFRATGLRPFLDALADDDQRARFLARLRSRTAQAYSRRADGRVILPFRRLFFVAYRR